MVFATTQRIAKYGDLLRICTRLLAGDPLWQASKPALKDRLQAASYRFNAKYSAL